MQAASSRMLFVMAFLIVILASGNADNWFTRRRNQQSFQRPLSSHFRQRIGVQVPILIVIAIALELMP